MISAKDARDLQYFYKRLNDITISDTWEHNYLDLCNSYPDITTGIEEIKRWDDIIQKSLNEMIERSERFE